VLQAPFSIGDTVSPQSAVFVIGDLSGLRVETFVPERFVAAIRQGLRGEVTFEAIPGETFLAEIDEINPVLDPASRTLRIRLRFVNAAGAPFMDPRIRAGMFATVNLVTQTRQGVIVVPRTSVISTRGTWVVFTVEGETGIASQREVLLGIENEPFAQIVSGIEVGDIVVSAGQKCLTNGDRVRIVD
jgi:RND family efflux transporter MFP subunit